MSDKPIEKYGALWPGGMPAWRIEGALWRHYLNPEKKFDRSLARWQHLKNLVLLLDPEFRNGWNDWTEKMCWAYGTYQCVAALGCTGSTKTHTFHKLAFYDYFVNHEDTYFTCTTTDAAGIDVRMWPRISEAFSTLQKAGVLDESWKQVSHPHRLIKHSKSLGINVVKALVLPRAADRQAVIDAIAGAHPKRGRIVIVDEATSCSPAFHDAFSNIFMGCLGTSGDGHARLVMLGNPDDPADTLGQFCRPDTGWDSVDDQTESWTFTYKGLPGIGLHFDGRKSPNVVGNKVPRFAPGTVDKAPRPFMFSAKDLVTAEASKDLSPLSYWKQCVGWYAPEGISKRIVSAQLLDRYKCREKAILTGEDTIFFAGCDPAFGGDRAMLMIWQKGTDAHSLKRKTVFGLPDPYAKEEKPKVVMNLEKKIQISIDPNGLPGEQIGQEILRQANIYGFTTVGVDTTTNNSAAAEWLERNTALKVIWVNFGGAASEDPISPTDTRPAKEAYVNRATELAFRVASNLEVIHGLDVDTYYELTSRFWRSVGGKPERQQIETKEEYKLRMHRSPDDADTVAISLEVFRQLGHLSPTQKSPKSREKWNAAAKRKAALWNEENAYVG